MLIRHADQVEGVPMQMSGASGVTMRLMVGRQDGAPTFAMRQFEVEPGGHTPLHEHNYEHEVIVIAGRGLAVSGSSGTTTRPIEAGDTLFIPPNETHQFRNAGPGVLRFVCLVPIKHDCGNGTCVPTPGS